MEIIEQIGSYAGLAAIVGLAVLSALYFSQARDVRRLREVEEGRAPSMATPQLRAAQRAAASPAQSAAQAPGQAAGPAGKPAEPQPTGVTRVGPPAPAAPTASVAGPQTAAAKQTGAEGAAPEPAQAAAPGEGPAETERAAATVGAGAQAGSPTAVPARTAGPAHGGNAQGARPVPTPAAPRRPTPPPGAAALRLGQTSATRRAPWYGRLDPRYTILIVAAALVLGIGGVVGIYALGSGDDAGTDPAADGGEQGSAPLDPSTITVAVLNGTSVAGAADQVANVVESAGYQRGTVDNAAESSAESAVLFAEGAKPAARQVGRELDISQVELIDSETEALVGTADVTVVVGADQAE
jgi:hypothetical protein